MNEYSIAVDIKASPQSVLAVLCDVERWPQWTSTVTRVRRMEPGPLAVGSRVRIHQPKLMPATWIVTELDPAHFTWVTRSPGIQVEAVHAVASSPAGSRVTLAIRFTGLFGSLLARIYRDLNQRYLGIEAEGLRKRCEPR